MTKLAGCSKDHAKEIDLYNKSYDEKLEQVCQMMGQAKSALSAEGDRAELLQKACYYYT